MASTPESTRAVEVFFCYSHKDEVLREELEKHLSVFKRQGLITGWHDRDIKAGTEWEKEIDKYLNSAQIILFLVSSDFVASDYCYSLEMQRALERHDSGEARVIPIILRPVDWRSAPFGKLQVLPKNGLPITRWSDSDEAFLDVARGIRNVVKEVTARSTNSPAAHYPSTALADPITEPVPPIVWNAPYPLHPFFIDREQILDNLCKTLMGGTALPVAITGTDGTGKTQLALKYAYQYNKNYQAILWANAESRPLLISDIVTIAGLLDLPEKNEQNYDRTVAAVKGWMEDHTDWLLILDNVSNLGVVNDFLALANRGHILLTAQTLTTGKLAQRVKLDQLEIDDGVRLLLHRAKIITPDKPGLTSDNAKEIVEIVNGLPLAIDLAGAYIKETGCGVANYPSLYWRATRQIHELTSNYPEAIATTWLLTFEMIKQTNAAAIDLLHLCAFLYPDAIPEEMLTEGIKELNQTHGSIADKSPKLDTMLNKLLAFSLVGRAFRKKTITIHPLIQGLVRNWMDKDTEREWTERSIRVVNRVFPQVVEFSTWARCDQYLPHAYMCVDDIKQWDTAIPEAVQLLHRVASYLKARGQHSQAELLATQALDIHERILGPNHPDVAQSLNNLAEIYHAQGKYNQAEPLYEKALAISRRALGPSHPDVAECLNNLATFYNDQNRYSEAEALFKQALAIREKNLVEDDPAIATSLNNLGLLYYTQGKYDEAEPLFKKALSIREKALGQKHPDVATSLNNLAALYNNQGRYEEAKELFERALAIDKQAFGLNYPNVARDYSNLGGVLEAQGDLQNAQTHYKQALSIDEKTYGPNHPHIAVDISNLGSILQKQGELSEAQALYERALSIDEKAYGRYHPSVATRLNNLGSVLQEQGDLAEAQICYEQALTIVEAVYGQNHPNVASILNNLASVLVDDLPRAQTLYEKALTIALATYGPNHLQVGNILNNIANVLQKMGDTTGALIYYREALQIFQEHFGKNHPSVTRIAEKLHNLSTIAGDSR